MKPTLTKINKALTRRDDLVDIQRSPEWSGSVVATFRTPSGTGGLTFLVKPGDERGYLSFIVPNLWEVPQEDPAWQLRSGLATSTVAIQCKPVIAPNGSLHMALDVPVAAGMDLDEVIERGLALLRRDLDGLRPTVIALAHATKVLRGEE